MDELEGFETNEEVVGNDGFGKHADRFAKTIYVGRNDSNPTDCWYFLEGDKENRTRKWIDADYLDGVIKGIDTYVAKSQKYGDTVKLAVVMTTPGGKDYAIRSNLLSRDGNPGTFARGLLSNLLACRPLLAFRPGHVRIGVKASDQDATIVFPYVSQNNENALKKGSSWLDKSSDFLEVAKQVADNFGVPYKHGDGERRGVATVATAESGAPDKARKFIEARLIDAKVPVAYWEPTISNLIGNPSFKLANADLATARIIKAQLLDTFGSLDLNPLARAYQTIRVASDSQFPDEPEDAPWEDQL